MQDISLLQQIFRLGVAFLNNLAFLPFVLGIEGLKASGLTFTAPQGAMYVWISTPEGTDPWSFTEKLYREYGILVVPGTAYGANGSRKVIMGLVQELEVMKEAARRLAEGRSW